MAWDTEMIEIVRVLINDMGDTPTFSDERLRRLIVVAALQVTNELGFSQDFRSDVEHPNITPDPTVADTRDDSFVNLVCLKAACIVDHGAAIIASKQAIAVRDGSSAIDLRGNLQGKLKLLEKGWCAVYNDTKYEYQTVGGGCVAGSVVMTPFRRYAYDTYSNRGNIFSAGRTRDYY